MSLTHYLSEVKERAEKARRHVHDLAAGKKKWNMCIPPQEEEDSDFVLSAPTEDVERLVCICEAQAAALGKIANGQDGISYHEYIGPNGEGVSETDDVHKLAREALSTADLIAKGFIPLNYLEETNKKDST